ncbi:metal-dependent hydrolase [Pseudoroseomonas globiformis]|uniref:Metal-dependent hydrolase n=1 Tax=Teichococcus globiformis TaxID=2307229 RepID=A0ABV7FXQ0_9PROT
MMAGSHVALGAAAWLAAAPLFAQPAVAPLPLAVAALGALMPDIDHPSSWVGKRCRPFSLLLTRLLGHRGATHSLLAAAACFWLLLRPELPLTLSAPFVVGYLSHLGADLLTPGGLRLAWPLKGTWSLPLCRTGSAFEPLLVAIILSWAWSGADGMERMKAGLRELGVCELPFQTPGLCSPGPAGARLAAVARP